MESCKDKILGVTTWLVLKDSETPLNNNAVQWKTMPQISMSSLYIHFRNIDLLLKMGYSSNKYKEINIRCCAKSIDIGIGVSPKAYMYL